METDIFSKLNFTDIPISVRLSDKVITREDLYVRAKKFFKIVKGDRPLRVNNKIGCPVCLSELSDGNCLVRERDYIVCDYCVPYVEDLILEK